MGTAPHAAADTNDAMPEEVAGNTGGCGSCSCGSGGCGDGGGRVPELDARPIDSALRQAAILGVLVGLVPGASAAIVTKDEPELVLMLIEQQFAGQYEVTGGQSGPEEWRTKFLRVA